MQLAIFEIKASGFDGVPRYGHPAIVFLGQALQTGAGVHRFTNGKNDPSRWGAHGADNRLTERNVSTTLRQPNVEFKLGVLEFSSVD
jgi:hypothetical protein